VGACCVVRLWCGGLVSEAQARAAAEQEVLAWLLHQDTGRAWTLPPVMQAFLLLPLEHSEELAMQEVRPARPAHSVVDWDTAISRGCRGRRGPPGPGQPQPAACHMRAPTHTGVHGCTPCPPGACARPPARPPP
jgi:hypothetical protein